MAAPTYTKNLTQFDNFSGGSTGGSLDGASAYGTLEGGKLGGNGSGTHLAARHTFSANQDVTGSKYLYLTLEQSQTSNYRWFEDNGTVWASGASLRIYFLDGSGNWSGFKIASRDMTDSGIQGEFIPQYSYIDHPQMPAVLIDRTATPDFSSGTLDWSDLDAVEIHGLTDISQNQGWSSHTISGLNAAEIVDGEVGDPGTIQGLYDLYTISFGGGAPHAIVSMFRPSSQWTQTLQDTYLLHGDIDVGDGVTTTRFESNSEFLTWVPSNTCFDTEPFQRNHPPGIIADGASTVRRLLIDQSASCVALFTSGAMQASLDSVDEADIILQGSTSGTCTFTEFNFTGMRSVQLAHATATSSVFDTCEEVVCTTDTTITGGTIRNTTATSKGLYIDGAPGDYSGLDVRFASTNAGDDITINPSSTGTYNLTGISADSGHTVAIHNESASTAITVQVPAGITTSTTTAGGTVTVEPPDLDVTITCVDTGGTAIQNARVRVVTDPGGTVVLEGLTDVNGEVTDTYSGSTPQAITGTARRASSGLGATLYKPASIIGSIGASGLDQTVVMIEDA